MSLRYEQAKIIDGIYKEFLGRGADADGIRYHLGFFSELGLYRGTQKSIQILMNSDEFQENKAHKNKIKIDNGHKLINGNPVSHLVSLGSHCLPAIVLRKYGLKRETTPFDWCYAPPSMVTHCIDDNFETLLNKDNIISVMDGRKSVNRHYWPESVHHNFPHHDLNRADDYERFKRYVSRFNSILDSKESKLFLIVTRKMYDLEGNFEKLKSSIRNRTSNFKLIGVQLGNDEEMENKFSMQTISYDEYGDLYRFNSRSLEEGRGEYELTSDEIILLSLITDYRLELQTC
ncbi:hypothetical protein FD737_10150 [Pantoea sp. Seng]|uniref:DUF1796 family putative cysteine peptidase n=1 Tax=Pantoea sp. Seng TaxID=2576761 RepID=UPI001324C015|nr:DUF1796 family putative cysteine peptidase [Pantoea sp. Seng]MXP53440.1 hypothetical protein [Pantoea sp. Seng]